MSRHRPEVSLRQMLEHAEEAISLAEGKSRTDLDTDRTLCLALLKLVEIVGEAARRIPEEEQEKHPGIPWPEIIAMRNRLVHAYDSINLDVLWNIVRKDLPQLANELRKTVDFP